jgi:hypothetical protein
LNPYRIYRDEWAEALRDQVVAASYDSFVAIPFQEHFSYRSKEILSGVIGKAVEEANARASGLPRKFAVPERVDAPRGAVVITDEIVRKILRSHYFIADLTFQNAGVVLETGVALGTKPNQQIVLITQGRHEELHFDIRNNQVIGYNSQGAASEIANALLAAAEHFESQAAQHVLSVTRRLSPEAILALNWYGQIQRKDPHASLHAGNLPPFLDSGAFHRGTAELRERDLLWTDYAVGAVPGGDAFGMHATEFGWAVIESMWAVLRRGT